MVIVYQGMPEMLPFLVETVLVSSVVQYQCTYKYIFLFNIEADFQFTLSTFSAFENAGPLMGSVRLNTAGLIEEQILVVVQTVASGTATGNAVSNAFIQCANK